MSEDRPAVRRIAVLALADLEDEAMLGPIVAAMRTDTSWDVRAQAAAPPATRG
ncbi:hypothetical protein [Paraburkholderia sp. GAS348]|uniref:hypothetical protein n=1 Tax=Paraburkholderia sp. GAS348 TaxID=3035132 RepID=UPI003D253B75